MIYISSDHRGFNLKKYILNNLTKKGYEVEDLGPKELNLNDDYPDFAHIIAKKVQENDQNKGIIICGNGVGVSITTNKFKGIRTTLSWTANHARSSRNDDDSNILALPSDYISKKQALKATITWLNTPFSNEERHLRRLQKIKDIESNA